MGELIKLPYLNVSVEPLVEVEIINEEARIAELKRAHDAAIEKLHRCRDEYQKKFDVPFIGFFYAMPAWRRYRWAYKEYDAIAEEYISALRARSECCRARFAKAFADFVVAVVTSWSNR